LKKSALGLGWGCPLRQGAALSLRDSKTPYKSVILWAWSCFSNSLFERTNP
jgi:hypothetical protein